MYEPLKNRVLSSEFPLYVVQLITFYVMAHLYDYHVNLNGGSEGEMSERWEVKTIYAIMIALAAF